MYQTVISDELKYFLAEYLPDGSYHRISEELNLSYIYVSGVLNGQRPIRSDNAQSIIRKAKNIANANKRKIEKLNSIAS